MYLIINLGLKSIRGIIFNEEGRQIFSSSRAVYSKLLGIKVEQNVIEWKEKLEEILEEIARNTTLAPQIKYITSTTSSSCVYGMDKDANPITPVMMVSDKRGKKEADDISQLDAFKKQTVGLKSPASSVLPKALWYKRNEPEIFEKVDFWMGAGEFINYFFTQEIFTDPLNASKAMHVNGGYYADVYNEAGISIDTIPEVKDIGYELSIKEDVKNRFRIPNDCKYILTTYDAICAVIGSFDGSHKTACDVSGTVTSVRVLTEQVLQKQHPILLSQSLGIFNKNLIGASNNLGGGIIEWFKQAFYDENDKNVYYVMENHAHQSSIGAKGMVFLPYLLGERAPFKAPDAKGTFFGLSRDMTVKDFARSVFEATAFVSNDLLQLSISNGVEIDAMTVSGGLARFDLINQIKADVINKPVKVLENFESTSVGAFILLAICINKYSSLEEAAEQSVKIRKIINPSKDNHEIYLEIFDLFKNLNQGLAPYYEGHMKVKEKLNSFSSETLSNL